MNCKIMDSLGLYIKKARNLKNISLSTVSKNTKISLSTLSRIENNKIKNIKNIHLYKLSKELDLDYNSLLRRRWELFPIFSYGRKTDAENK